MSERETGISYARLVEIATLLKDGLMEDGETEALEYLADTVEFTKEEADFFGVDYNEMEIFSKR